VRFALARHGEDPALIAAAFWREHDPAREGQFTLVPLWSYGVPPRPKLCTKASLTAGYLQYLNGSPKPDSPKDREWKSLLSDFGVSVNALVAPYERTLN